MQGLAEASDISIAVLIPCYNEKASIGKVVSDFQNALPQASVYVYDNNSTDATVEVARRAGAIIRLEKWQGKGNVMRRMFADIEADIFVLVDGDDTYDASQAPMLIMRLLENSLDMVVGARTRSNEAAFPPGHIFGNRLLTGIVQWMFGHPIKDMLSGYRVFSRRFLKSFPALADGFETETKLTVHALELRIPFEEINVPYKQRAEGSKSKLNTISDGLRIIGMILLLLLKEIRPLLFFGVIAGVLATISVGLAIPIFVRFMEHGDVPRFPTAILCTGLMLLAFLSLSSGWVLSSIAQSRREVKGMLYLAAQHR